MTEPEWAIILSELRTFADVAETMCAAAAAKSDDRAVTRELRHFERRHAEHIARIDDLLADSSVGTIELPDELQIRLADQARRVAEANDVDGALRSLLDAELLQAQRYEAARRLSMPPAVAAFVTEGLADEQHHLDWLQSRTHLAAGSGARS